MVYSQDYVYNTAGLVYIFSKNNLPISQKITYGCFYFIYKLFTRELLTIYQLVFNKNTLGIDLLITDELFTKALIHNMFITWLRFLQNRCLGYLFLLISCAYFFITGRVAGGANYLSRCQHHGDDDHLLFNKTIIYHQQNLS